MFFFCCTLILLYCLCSSEITDGGVRWYFSFLPFVFSSCFVLCTCFVLRDHERDKLLLRSCFKASLLFWHERQRAKAPARDLPYGSSKTLFFLMHTGTKVHLKRPYAETSGCTWPRSLFALRDDSGKNIKPWKYILRGFQP